MAVWSGEGAFLDLLRADPDVRAHLTYDELTALFDPTWHFKYVDTIFARVFGEAVV
jgi:adenylosuccinate lyase